MVMNRASIRKESKHGLTTENACNAEGHLLGMIYGVDLVNDPQEEVFIAFKELLRPCLGNRFAILRQSELQARCIFILSPKLLEDHVKLFGNH